MSRIPFRGIPCLTSESTLGSLLSPFFYLMVQEKEKHSLTHFHFHPFTSSFSDVTDAAACDVHPHHHHLEHHPLHPTPLFLKSVIILKANVWDMLLMSLEEKSRLKSFPIISSSFMSLKEKMSIEEEEESRGRRSR